VGLKFIDNDAFRMEYTDIFLAAGIIDRLNLDKEEIVAGEVLSFFMCRRAL